MSVSADANSTTNPSSSRPTDSRTPAEEIVVPVGAVEVSITPGDDGQFGTSDDEARITKRDLTEVEEVMEEVVEDIVEAETETATLDQFEAH